MVTPSSLAPVVVASDINNTNKKGQNKGKEPSVPPTNVLLDYSALQLAMKEFCCPLCMKKHQCIKQPDNYKTLVISQTTHGFASIVTIHCKKCKEDVTTIEPQHKHTKFVGKGSKGGFMQYAINYNMVLVMQQLGMSLTGLANIFGCLGIAAGIGGMDKWKDIQDTVGAAQQEVCEEVLCANIEMKIAATKADAKKKAEEWAKAEGKQDDEEGMEGLQ